MAIHMALNISNLRILLSKYGYSYGTEYIQSKDIVIKIWLFIWQSKETVPLFVLSRLLCSLWVSRTESASDWCALQEAEALYKCIDTIQYNNVANTIQYNNVANTIQ